MIEEMIDVASEEGLHTRPANSFVKLAKGFSSKITISKGEKSAAGTSLLKIMKLGVVQGDSVKVTCEGEDEAQAMEVVRSFLQRGPSAAGEEETAS